MRKNFLLVVLLIVSMFWNLTCLKALPSSLGPITQVGSKVDDSCASGNCYGLALKVSGSTATLCTEY